MHHVFALNGTIGTTLVAGGKLVTLPKFTPDTFANAIKVYKVWNQNTWIHFWTLGLGNVSLNSPPFCIWSLHWSRFLPVALTSPLKTCPVWSISTLLRRPRVRKSSDSSKAKHPIAYMEKVPLEWRTTIRVYQLHVKYDPISQDGEWLRRPQTLWWR